MAEGKPRHILVEFGRDVTPDDLERLKAINDVARVSEAIDVGLGPRPRLKVLDAVGIGGRTR